MSNAAQSAQTAASFLNALGVNSHLDHSGTAYRRRAPATGDNMTVQT